MHLHGTGITSALLLLQHESTIHTNPLGRILLPLPLCENTMLYHSQLKQTKT